MTVKRRKVKGGTLVWMAGKPVLMHYTMNSLCAMEARAGMPLDELMDHHFSATRLLLWAGLRDCYPGVTVWDAGELISKHLQRGGTLEEVIDICARGLRKSGLIDGDAS